MESPIYLVPKQMTIRCHWILHIEQQTITHMTWPDGHGHSLLQWTKWTFYNTCNIEFGIMRIHNPHCKCLNVECLCILTSNFAIQTNSENFFELSLFIVSGNVSIFESFHGTYEWCMALCLCVCVWEWDQHL